MKRKVIEVITELLVMQMNHLVLISGVITVLGAFGKEEPYFGLWFAMWLVPLLFYIVREKVHNFFLFFALHLFLPIVVLFTPVGVLIKLLILAMVLIYIIWSIRIRLMSEVKQTGLIVPLVAVIAIGGLSLIQNIFIGKSWEKYYMTAIFMYLLCYFIYYFMSRYLRFLQVHATSTANIPEKAIFFSGLKQTVVYTAGGMFIMFLTANIEWLSYVLSLLGRGFVSVLRFIFSLFPGKETEEIVETATGQGRPNGDMSGFMEPGEAHIIWIILEKLLMAAMAVGFVLLIVYAAVKGYQFLWKNFHKERKSGSKYDEDVPDVREKCGIEKSIKGQLKFISFSDNREKVRKVFRKHILKSKNSIIGDSNINVLECLTAKECCDKISADALQFAYDKARYSSEMITAKEVKQVKTAVK